MTAIDTGATQPNVSNPERTVSAIFKERVDNVIRRLLDRGIWDDISVIGKNFHSETKIAGFITKKDVILGGLRQGAIFGSLFGSALALLTGVCCLFLCRYACGSRTTRAALLGATSGAIAGSAGAGLVSAVTLGLPEDKAAVYQTHRSRRISASCRSSADKSVKFSSC